VVPGDERDADRDPSPASNLRVVCPNIRRVG